MKEQVMKAASSTKEFWDKQPKKRKIYFGALVGGILAVSLLITIVLNFTGNTFKVLYPGITSEESVQVFAALQAMSAPAKMNEKGEVLVPQSKADVLMTELSAQGYPKTAPAFGIFSDNAGFTTTEFEKKQYLLFNLEEKIKVALKKIDGVNTADVTLVVPQETNYVWEQESSKSSAAILMTMSPGVKLSPDKVAAVQSLVASSVPKMEVSAVTVVDAATGLQMKSSHDSATGDDLGLERLGFEAEIENTITQKVINVLSLGYSPESMRVSATVVIDYDKMLSESMEYQPGANGGGIAGSESEKYTMDAQTFAEGVVGEENNTDAPIPTYVDTDGDGVPEYIDYSKDAEYLVSYLKTQIEKDKAIIKDTTLSITVATGADGVLSEQTKAAIIESASKAANVLPQNISVNGFVPAVPPNVPTGGFNLVEQLKRPVVLLSILGVMILLVVILLIFNMFKKRGGASAVGKGTIVLPSGEVVAAGGGVNFIEEINEHKRMLKENAEALNGKENMMTNEIREFANANPEITATLLRSWLKEEE